MPRVMVTLRLDPEQASLPEVRRLLGLATDEVDPTFGVVNISPAEHLYTILVDEAAAERVAGVEQHADGARVQQLGKGPACVVSLPDRDRHRRFAGDAHQGGGITGQARLLQKRDAQWRQGDRGADRDRPVLVAGDGVRTRRGPLRGHSGQRATSLSRASRSA
jgi:hypothetical protein